MRKVAFKKYHDFSGNTDGNFFFFMVCLWAVFGLSQSIFIGGPGEQMAAKVA